MDFLATIDLGKCNCKSLKDVEELIKRYEIDGEKVMKYCLIVGDIINGVSIWGPFDSESGARGWAVGHMKEDNWIVSVVNLTEEWGKK